VAKATAVRRHTTSAGETLSGLARQFLGDESKARAIRNLNPTLPEGDDLPAGTSVVLPDGGSAEP
jgi:hypothetical protein